MFRYIGHEHSEHWPTNSIQTADVDASEMIFFLIYKLFYSMTGNADFTGSNLVESFNTADFFFFFFWLN